MDKIKTIYKLRKYKNEILFSIFTLTIGLGAFCVINIFESKILLGIQNQVLKLSIEQGAYNDLLDTNISNNTINMSSKIFGFFEKASLVSIVFALEGFIMILFFIRLSSRTSKFSKISPIILNIGVILLFVYYIILGFKVIANGMTLIFEINNIFFLKVISIIFIVLSNISFIYQIFNQIVLEKDYY